MVVNELREAMLLAQGIQETMSPDTCQQIMSHVANVKRMLALEASSRTPMARLPAPTKARLSTARIELQPTFSSRRRLRAAPSAVLNRAQGSVARQAVRDVIANDIGSVKRPRVHEDHSY